MDARRDEDAVLSTNGAFYTAFEKLDVDAMDRLWSKAMPVTCIHPRGQLLEGHDAVMASWRDIFRSTPHISFNLIGVRAFVARDTAWVVLIEQMEARQGERVVRAETQSTNVFVRESGAWKIVHHHAEPATNQKTTTPPKSPPTKAQLN